MYYYTILFNKNTRVDKKTAIRKIKSILNDIRGWRKMGYNFHYIPENLVHTKGRLNFVIIFASNQFIVNTCGMNINKLSCADMSTNTIYINTNRWREGSIASKLNIHNYRTYVINHEVGHILGRHHIRCRKDITSLAPIMMQQTLGIGGCTPNCWPLDWE